MSVKKSFSAVTLFCSDPFLQGMQEGAHHHHQLGTEQNVKGDERGGRGILQLRGGECLKPNEERAIDHLGKVRMLRGSYHVHGSCAVNRVLRGLLCELCPLLDVRAQRVHSLRITRPYREDGGIVLG